MREVKLGILWDSYSEVHVLTTGDSSSESLSSVRNCMQKQNPALNCLRAALRKTPKNATYLLY